MKLAGLSGGAGSGKSTVAALLVERGAIVVDVDVLSRALQQPGRPVFTAMVLRWGDTILRSNGDLDRQAVANIVFNDREELAALHAITNEPIEEEIYSHLNEYQKTDRIVILEAALLAGAPGLYGIRGLLVVDTPMESAITRLVEQRGMLEADARARLASQPPRDVRLQHAGFVIDNSREREALPPQVDRAWEWLRSLANAKIKRRLPRSDPVD